MWIVTNQLFVQYVIQIENGIINNTNVNVKVIVHAKKFIVGILAHALREQQTFEKFC